MESRGDPGSAYRSQVHRNNPSCVLCCIYAPSEYLSRGRIKDTNWMNREWTHHSGSQMVKHQRTAMLQIGWTRKSPPFLSLGGWPAWLSYLVNLFFKKILLWWNKNFISASSKFAWAHAVAAGSEDNPAGEAQPNTLFYRRQNRYFSSSIFKLVAQFLFWGQTRTYDDIILHHNMRSLYIVPLNN